MTEEIAENKPILVQEEEGLTLRGEGLCLRGDFTKMLPRLRYSVLFGELLVKAAKIKDGPGLLYAVDATAGLGEDSLLLAAAGFQVRMYEKDPMIAALLRDAMERGLKHPDLRGPVSRMTLLEEDSIPAMRQMKDGPDVILLDPMFPERQKSGLIKKKFQMIHELEKPCDNEEELLEAALAANPRKIIVKRPLKGPYLGDRKPEYSLNGKAIRYDILTGKGR